jgi:hypothetical protein
VPSTQLPAGQEAVATLAGTFAEQLTKLLHSVPQVVGLLCKALCSGSSAAMKLVQLQR